MDAQQLINQSNQPVTTIRSKRISPSYERQVARRQTIRSIKSIPRTQAKRVGRVLYQARPQRIEPQKRRMPGQSMISTQSANAVTRFIAGRSIGGSGTNRRVTGRVGRPAGPSGRYIIPGKGPVGVYEYRKYARLRNRYELMQQQMQMAQNPQYQQQYPQQVPQRYVQQIPQQPQQVVQRITPQAPNYPQQQASVQDDGWGLLRIKSPFSQNAPASPVNPIANAQQPVGNPQTAYFSEPDFISGKQVMKQRPNMGGFGLW